MSHLVAPLITPAELQKIQGNPDLRILDATWIAPFVDPTRHGVDLFRNSHVKGAQFFDTDEIAAPDTDLPHMLPSPDQFETQIGALGITHDDHVVIYDQNSFLASARAWWMFRVMGHQKVSVLNGGLVAWRDIGGAVETGETTAPERRIYKSDFQPQLITVLSVMQAMVEQNRGLILDARPAARFQGRAPEPRQGLRGGHMPGARSLPHTDLLDASGALKPIEDLRALFAPFDVSEAELIVTTCGSGVTAAVLTLAMAAIGRIDVALYDGSWSEWGAAAGCPCLTE